jgi:hypothetical protein
MLVSFVFFFQFYVNIKYVLSRLFHQHGKVVKMLGKKWEIKWKILEGRKYSES